LRSATFPVAIAKAQQLTRSGACTEALAWYNRAIQLNPASGPAFYQRAILYLNRGDRQGAMNDLGRFLELNPGDVTAARFRGMIAQGIVQPVGRCQD
jgi:regulator of sirC expression with transglutaminase-like and TPR domain